VRKQELQKRQAAAFHGRMERRDANRVARRLVHIGAGFHQHACDLGVPKEDGQAESGKTVRGECREEGRLALQKQGGAVTPA
jgi:hypothetical protein